MLPISANLLFASRLAGEGLLFFPGAGMGAFFKTRLSKKTTLSVFPEGPFFLLKDRQAGGEWFPVLLLLTERVGGGRRRHPSLLIAKRF